MYLFWSSGDGCCSSLIDCCAETFDCGTAEEKALRQTRRQQEEQQRQRLAANPVDHAAEVRHYDSMLANLKGQNSSAAPQPPARNTM